MRRAVEHRKDAGPDGRKALEDVLASDVLGKSKRQVDLLRFLVEEMLAGRHERLKAYTIAVEALGRGEDFDPASDSIVRVEVGRLRQALERYAAGAPDGADLIDIPKGQYVPVVSRKPGAASPPRSAARPSWVTGAAVLLGIGVLLAIVAVAVLRGDAPPVAVDEPSATEAAGPGPRLALSPFVDLSETEIGARMSYGMGIEVASMLHAFPWMSVYIDRGASPSPIDASDYRLDGTVSISDGTFITTVRLFPPGGDTPIWTEEFSGVLNVANLVEAQGDVAERIALEIGGRDRAVARAELERAKTTGDLSAYVCVLAIHRYWRFFRESEHQTMRACLEEATRTEPQYADAWAALSFIYLDEHRYGYNPVSGRDGLRAAREAAQRAWDLDPDAGLPSQALFTVHAIDGARDEFLRIGRRVLAKAPSNPDLRADFGTKMAVNFGLWDEGVTLVIDALARNPKPPQCYFIAPAFDAFLRGDAREAVRLSERINAPGFAPYQIVRLVSFAALGDQIALTRQRESAARLGALDLESAVAMLSAMGYEGHTHETLRSALALAFADLEPTGRPSTPRIRVSVRDASSLARSVEAMATSVLSRFDLIGVIDAVAGEHVWPEDYELSIDIARGDTSVFVTATVTHLASGDVVTSISQDLPLDTSGAFPREDRVIFETAIAGFGQRAGPVIGDYARRGEGTPVMTCLLLTRAYFDDQTDTAHRNAVECLRRTLARNPSEYALHASLGMMLREAYTDQRPSREEEPLVAALASASRGTELAPSSAMAHYIESGILYLLGDTDRMIAIGRRAVDLNPYDAEIVGGVAARLAYAGRFEEALPLLDASVRLNPKASRWRDHAYFLAYFGLNDFDRAISSASGLVGTTDTLYLATRIMARHLDGRDNVSELIALIESIEPGFREEPAALYRRRNYDGNLIDRLVAVLRDAGV